MDFERISCGEETDGKGRGEDLAGEDEGKWNETELKAVGGKTRTQADLGKVSGFCSVCFF